MLHEVAGQPVRRKSFVLQRLHGVSEVSGQNHQVAGNAGKGR
jgi:hypothetical protein